MRPSLLLLSRWSCGGARLEDSRAVELRAVVGRASRRAARLVLLLLWATRCARVRVCAAPLAGCGCACHRRAGPRRRCPRAHRHHHAPARLFKGKQPREGSSVLRVAINIRAAACFTGVCAPPTARVAGPRSARGRNTCSLAEGHSGCHATPALTHRPRPQAVLSVACQVGQLGKRGNSRAKGRPGLGASAAARTNKDNIRGALSPRSVMQSVFCEAAKPSRRQAEGEKRDVAQNARQEQELKAPT